MLTLFIHIFCCLNAVNNYAVNSGKLALRHRVCVFRSRKRFGKSFKNSGDTYRARISNYEILWNRFIIMKWIDDRETYALYVRCFLLRYFLLSREQLQWLLPGKLNYI